MDPFLEKSLASKINIPDFAGFPTNLTSLDLFESFIDSFYAVLISLWLNIPEVRG